MNAHPFSAWSRGLGTGLTGVVLAASLAGCSLDAPALWKGVKSSWEGPDKSLSGSHVPVRLEIPTIGVRRSLVAVQVQLDESLGVPDSGEDIGWYSPDEDPEGGHPTVFVAHVDTPTGPAVFNRLPELQPGDEMAVTTAGGDVGRYRVDRVEDYAIDDFPTLEVYGPVADDEIRLLTCSGEFDPVRQQYDNNRVVYASRVP